MKLDKKDLESVKWSVKVQYWHHINSQVNNKIVKHLNLSNVENRICNQVWRNIINKIRSQVLIPGGSFI